jgi:hypothetical protein
LTEPRRGLHGRVRGDTSWLAPEVRNTQAVQEEPHCRLDSASGAEERRRGLCVRNGAMVQTVSKGARQRGNDADADPITRRMGTQLLRSDAFTVRMKLPVTPCTTVNTVVPASSKMAAAVAAARNPSRRQPIPVVADSSIVCVCAVQLGPTELAVGKCEERKRPVGDRVDRTVGLN